jgi:hypothetical protein
MMLREDTTADLSINRIDIDAIAVNTSISGCLEKASAT